MAKTIEYKTNRKAVATSEVDQHKVENRRPQVKQIINNVCNLLNSAGVNPRDYVEQLAWMFFLKAFDEAEAARAEIAVFGGAVVKDRLTVQYRWSAWSKRTDKPDDLIKFVNEELWPKLLGLGEDPVAQRFNRVFSSVKNHCRSGAIFARVVDHVNQLHFSDHTDVIVLSEIYEHLLKQVADDSPGWAGEFYTPRHIIRAMVKIVRPNLGDRIYDPCFGSAGFPTESADYIQKIRRLSVGQSSKSSSTRLSTELSSNRSAICSVR
jgi:type I restriction enzyme M protein